MKIIINDNKNNKKRISFLSKKTADSILKILLEIQINEKLFY